MIIVEGNKVDVEREQLLIAAQSKYHLETNCWNSALADANRVLAISNSSNQAYLSRIIALFNLCNFEQVWTFDLDCMYI